PTPSSLAAAPRPWYRPPTDRGASAPHTSVTLTVISSSWRRACRDAGGAPPGPRRPDRGGKVRAGARGGPAARRRRAGVGRLDAGVPTDGHRHREAHAGGAGRATAPPPRPR